ncbi:MAG: 1-acyl-sn-glycerol-3-phosphate acyltransferase [bacterium]|nr:1-acyl-sn-glycerol-3-phosphate acyltransferase [bacterium]
MTITPEEKKTEKRKFARRYAKEYHTLRWMFHIFTIGLCHYYFKYCYQFKVEGKENIPKSTRVIYAANHVSMFDPLFVSSAIFKPVAYMAKMELFEKDCNLQWWVKRLGAFSVNRDKPELSTFRTIAEVFKTTWSLGIFPQGGIRDNKKIENIQKGFAIIAHKTKADIVPVAICGFDGYKKGWKAHQVTIKIGKPISHTLDPEEIMQQWAKFICDNTGFENCINTEKEEELLHT